jgi:tRNA A-37 threonylcarbamoyl transferase component Bud32/Ca2+-binding EF-hand superfamily protein
MNIKCNFDKIKSLYEIKNTENLTAYLNDIFLDLSMNSKKEKEETLDKITFINYLGLPFIISEKIFSLFDKNNQRYITWDDFLEGVTKLYLGTLDETENFIFQMFDFDKDGKIIPEDVRLILTFLSSKQNGIHKTTEEIMELVSQFFGDSKSMNFKDFVEITENKYSDIYFIMVYFLYENKPYRESSVRLYNFDKSRIVSKLNKYALSCRTTLTEEISSPIRKVLVSPTIKVNDYGIKIDVNKIIKKDTTLDNEMEEDLKLLQEFTISAIKIPTIHAKNMMYLDNNALIATKSKSNKLTLADMESTRSSINLNDRRKSCLIEQSCKYKFGDTRRSINVTSLNLTQNKQLKNEIIHEGDLYKVNKKGERKKFYIILLARDMFYFKSAKIDKLKGIHNLSNCFLMPEIDEFRYRGDTMYYFTVIFGERVREYYTKTKEDAEVWMTKFRQALNYRNIYEHYSFLDHLGSGSYGNVVLGSNDKSKEKFAIKVIDKSNKPARFLEFIKTEIEIMRFCKHENIIKFVDLFETADSIYIVQEYLQGGDLYYYYTEVMQKKISEDKIKHIMRQLGQGIKYLHEYGIIHRDIKPQNIMLTDKSGFPKVRIVDFGLSKVIGSNEKASECLGTLNFSAPEIVKKMGYNNRVDIWSLGVLIYYLLFDSLPFSDPDKQMLNVVTNICYKEYSIPNGYKVSTELLDLLKCCLEKNYDKRISIDEFLNHRWFR